MRKQPQQPQAGARDDMAEIWEFRLFVAGSGLEAGRAREALESVCQEHLPGRYRIVLVDVLQDPAQADAFDIVATPTLLRQLPSPVRRVIGDLALTEKTLVGLGIRAVREP